MNLLCSFNAAHSKWDFRHNRYRGRFVLLLLSLSALVSLRSPASATLLFEESFNYPANQSINKKSGGVGFVSGTNGVWNRSSQTFSDQVSSTGLTFQNLATSGNALLSHVEGGDDDEHQSIRWINPVPLSEDFSYWFSFLMRLDSIPEGTSISDFEGYVALMPANSGYSLRIGVSRGGSSISVTSNTLTSPKYSATDSITIGRTYFVVLHIAASNTGTIYLDPTPGDASPSDLSKLGSGALNIPAQFSRLGIFTTGVGADWMFDEFRMGTTYLDVAPIPEPSHVGLLALGGGSLLIMFCRRRFRRCALKVIE